MFTDTNINITADGRKHLGAVVGSDTKFGMLKTLPKIGTHSLNFFQP